ncbi:hypothetical protein MJ561_03660 [Klebsiella pneumoniae]|nr:hypothetical protein MJ561_03660 [Klebsiella pneumoniae]
MTGTHLSHANTPRRGAEGAGVRPPSRPYRALDIDYRPVLWGSPRSAMAKPFH